MATVSKALSLSLIVAATASACTKKEDKPEAPAASPAKSAAAPAEPTPEAVKTATAAPAGPPADSLKLPTLPAVKAPEDNPPSADKIALGHQLFFDKRLSVDGSVSCYSCHQNEHGNGGETPTAVGARLRIVCRGQLLPD